MVVQDHADRALRRAIGVEFLESRDVLAGAMTQRDLRRDVTSRRSKAAKIDSELRAQDSPDRRLARPGQTGVPRRQRVRA